MTEEVKIEINDSDSSEQIENTQVVDDPFVTKAKEMGWRPKDDFQGEDTDFVDAKEFVQRAPLFDKIESQNKTIKNLTKSFDMLKGHYTKVREMEFERALGALKADREAAVSDADGRKFEVVDKQIKRVEKEFEQLQADNTAVDTPDPAEFHAWQARNEWYTKDEELREYADTIGTRMANKGLAPAEVLAEVTRKVKGMFPHKFVNKNKQDAPDVGLSSGRGGKSSNASERFELSDFENQVMKTLLRDGTFKTKEEYISQLKALDQAGKR